MKSVSSLRSSNMDHACIVNMDHACIVHWSANCIDKPNRICRQWSHEIASGCFKTTSTTSLQVITEESPFQIRREKSVPWILLQNDKYITRPSFQIYHLRTKKIHPNRKSPISLESESNKSKRNKFYRKKLSCLISCDLFPGIENVLGPFQVLE